MAEILIVQGMNTGAKQEPRFRTRYTSALIEAIEGAPAGGAPEAPRPNEQSIDLLFWTDLVSDKVLPPTRTWSDLEDRVRASVLEADKPDSPWSILFRWFARQAVMYIDDMPAVRAADFDKSVPGSVRAQVLARAARKLASRPRIVLGHSMGSVIAYEALCRSPHEVDLLLTVGSPMGLPNLFLNKLAGGTPKPWPGKVRRWINVYSRHDPVFVPVPELSPLFAAGPAGQVIEDVEVAHGSILDDKTHELPSYLRDDKLAQILRSAWQDYVVKAP